MADTLGIITLSRSVEYTQAMFKALAEATKVDAPTTHVVVNNSNRMELTAAVLAGGGLALEPGYNTTFSAGNNMAARAIADRSDWLLLLNDDVEVGRDMLPNMWARRNQASVMGALLLHKDTGTVNHAGTLVTPKYTDHIGRNDPAADWMADHLAVVPAVTFAAALVKRELWDELGGLDEGYRYGWEDTDFCLRAMQACAIIGCARDAMGLHDECGTRPRGGKNDQANYELFQGKWQSKVATMLADYGTRTRHLTEGT